MLAEVKEKTATPITSAAMNRANFPLLRLKVMPHPDPADPASPLLPRPSLGAAGASSPSSLVDPSPHRRWITQASRLATRSDSASASSTRRAWHRPTLPATCLPATCLPTYHLPTCLPTCPPTYLPTCRGAL